MNANDRNTLTKCSALVAVFALAALALSPATVLARAEERITGTVYALSDTGISVKATDGTTVSVDYNSKTTFTQDNKPMRKSDIKVGNRIVIHAVKVDGRLVAHTVEIGQ